MKRFVFRLERVLGIRRFELERARIALAAIELEAARLAAALVEAERRLSAGRRLLEEEMAQGADGSRLALRAQAVRSGRTKWLFARQNVETFEPKRVRAREAVARCRARVESLEKLRERRAEVHHKAALAADQAELEGLALARYARSGVMALLACALLLSGSVPVRAEVAEGVSAAPPVEALLAGAGYSRGVDSILAEVQAREALLARRELELSEREGAVKELESMVAERAGELEKIRAEVETRILAWNAQGQDRIEQLSGVYAVMPPVEAAELLGKLELDLAVSVIRQMKKKVSANILAAMKPDRALQVSRRILQPLDPATDSPPARPY